jgi:ABC-type uncharacterized transport system substrate-binding protein
MKKKITVLTLCAMLFAPCSFAEAQQPKKVPRIGFLTSGFPVAVAHLLEGFKQGLRELGYVEGQNVLLELRYGEATAERLPILAAELVNLKVDVIVAVPNSAIEAVKHATQTIPIVMPIGSDPVGVGFVASLARPAGNITGLSAYSPELNGKRLELLKETVPKLSRVALLMSPNIPGNAIDLKETEVAARSLQLRTQLFEVRESLDLEGLFKAMIKERAEALIVFPGQPNIVWEPQTGRRTRSKESPAGDVSTGRLRHRRRPDVLRGEQSRSVPARRHLRRQDPKRLQAC